MADSTENTYSDQLAEFESELRSHIDDEDMLRDIHSAIKSLLSGNGASERNIRAVLQQQYDSGSIREESFELVQKLIDRIVTEVTPTDTAVSGSHEDPFGSTTIISAPDFSVTVTDQHLQVGSVLRDRFMLLEEISGGSMGTVYKALDRRLAEADTDHWVAIKVLSPQLSRDGNALRALQQEAAKTRCLSHPNIVRFIDLDREDDLYFLVMEWLEGQSLADILDDSASKKLEVEAALDIVGQLGGALDYAHKRGVVHADVKPGNVIITPSGEVKLFDFGVARIRQKQNSDGSEFDPGVLKAMTPAYSSMQVLTGEDPVPADDVFSLGCLAYRLIAGYRVFGPRNAAEAAEAGMEPQALTSLSDSQWRGIKKSLSFSRVMRYASAGEFVEALTPDQGKAEIEGAAPVRDEQQPSRRSWRPLVLALIFAAGVATVWQLDVLELPHLGSEVPDTEISADTVPADEIAVESQTAADRPQATATTPAVPPEPAPIDAGDERGADSTPDGPVEDAAIAGDTTKSTDQPEIAPVDFSTLPPADVNVALHAPGDTGEPTRLTLLEGGKAAVVEFVRDTQLDESLTLQLTEENFSGNKSPLASGQYQLSDNGVLSFPAGQDRARITISMSSDPVRESDVDVRLAVRHSERDNASVGSISVTLQDDDQRAFENSLAPNTVAFAVSQVSVRERDSAVQIDLIRYRPDASRLDVAYSIRDVTATEGDDYVDTGANSVSFEPGQRTVRILIPLVQDTAAEGDEAFMLELTDAPQQTESNIFRRIAVMIRDDDS